jgi:hypothetical protein
VVFTKQSLFEGIIPQLVPQIYCEEGRSSAVEPQFRRMRIDEKVLTFPYLYNKTKNLYNKTKKMVKEHNRANGFKLLTALLYKRGEDSLLEKPVEREKEREGERGREGEERVRRKRRQKTEGEKRRKRRKRQRREER